MASRALQRKLTEKCSEKHPDIYNKCFLGELSSDTETDKKVNDNSSISKGTKDLSDDNVSKKESKVT